MNIPGIWAVVDRADNQVRPLASADFRTTPRPARAAAADEDLRVGPVEGRTERAGHRLAADLGKRRAKDALDPGAAQLPPVTGQASRETLRTGDLSPRPSAPTQRRNDQRQARELQERAILPAAPA